MRTLKTNEIPKEPLVNPLFYRVRCNEAVSRV